MDTITKTYARIDDTHIQITTTAVHVETMTLDDLKNSITDLQQRKQGVIDTLNQEAEAFDAKIAGIQAQIDSTTEVGVMTVADAQVAAQPVETVEPAPLA